MEYHEQSLKNLGVAMQRTKRLCAIIVDTIGREIMINRPFSLDEVRGATVVQGRPGCAVVMLTLPSTVPPLPQAFPAFDATIAAIACLHKKSLHVLQHAWDACCRQRNVVKACGDGVHTWEGSNKRRWAVACCHAQNLWPRLEGSYEITAGQEIRLTVDAEASVSMEPVPRFPVNYANFTAMAEVGDTIFIGRYLVRLRRGSFRAMTQQ